MMTTGLIKTTSGNELLAITLGHSLLDDYLEFVAARARPNTLLAAAYDLKVFFTEVVKQPAEVSTADVLGFIKSQRAPRRRRRTRCPARRGGSARGGDDRAVDGVDRRLRRRCAAVRRHHAARCAAGLKGPGAVRSRVHFTGSSSGVTTC